MKKVLLYSGGMDSWLIDKLWKPDIKIYINIDGEYSKAEIARLPKDVQVVDFNLLGNVELPNKYIPMRNLYFLMIASHYGDEICLGATAGDGGKDKSLYFLENAEKIISDLWQDKKIYKQIKINKDFVKLSKGELVKKYLENGGSLEEIKNNTFSCYTPCGDKECYNCYPCFRKFAILYALGADYSEEIKKRMSLYVDKFIIPTKAEGGYEGTYYTDRGDESLYLIKAINLLKKRDNK